jgi:hypothetical protein
MSFLVYFFVLLVAASSVLFGLDWMQAPLQPPPAPRVQASAPAPQPQASLPAPQPTAAVVPAAAAQPSIQATNVSLTPQPPAQAAPETTAAAPIDALKAEATEATPAPLCDIAACERAYHTFTASDCTYKPSYGPRRLCTKGTPPRPSAQLASTEASARSGCNVSACESAYQSFDAATCTYQPNWGPRRLCVK